MSMNLFMHGFFQMCAKTTVAISPDYTTDRMWLNGVEETMENPRLRACIDEST